MTASAAPAQIFDVAVIGAGVVGCAVARALSLTGARVIVLEKGRDILSGASKANSALLHTGFDAPAGSFELQCVREGYAEYCAIRESLNLPLLETGAMVLAWTDEETAKLQPMAASAIANGVADVRILSAAEARAREPALAASVRGALLVPGEHVIDPWSAPLGYLTHAIANGATLLTDAEVTGGAFEGGVWRIIMPKATVAARYVVNCAGLYGDTVETRLLGDASFSIRPRRGQFVVFDKTAARFFRTILLPTPTEKTKGVVVARTIFGNVLVGPTAEDQDSRESAHTERAALERLIARAGEIVPGLENVPVTALYAGLRPATEEKDYRIRRDPARAWLSLGGVRSTGLTAALGLARYAASALAEMGLEARRHTPAAAPPMPNLAEHLPRDWSSAGYGEIVCHCEMVTAREIEAAFASPAPPRDLGGLKRRTRAGMGRCQGFYCSAKVATLCEARFAEPITDAVS